MLLLTTVTLLLVVVSMTYVRGLLPPGGNYNHPMFFYQVYRIIISRGLEVGKEVIKVNYTSCVRENSKQDKSFFSSYFSRLVFDNIRWGFLKR